MGRQKIEIKMVKDSSSRQVTFSKRRTGLFKKAHELSIMCGVEVAIIVFSPGNKPFSFGHPSVDAVVDKFLHREIKSSNGGASSSKIADMEKLNQQLEDVMGGLLEEEMKGKLHDMALNEYNLTKGKLPINGFGLGELQEFEGSLRKLKDAIELTISEKEALGCLALLAKKAVEKTENDEAEAVASLILLAGND